MSATDELLENARRHEEGFDKSGLAPAPARKLVVITCMDTRISPYAILGISEGDAHVIRNAGGVVTDDQIRSLAISQRRLGTEEIVVIQHTDCGMQSLVEHEFRSELARDAGVEPEWAVEAFADLEQSVRESVSRIEGSPFLPHKQSVRGFVYEVETGRLREIV